MMDNNLSSASSNINGNGPSSGSRRLSVRPPSPSGSLAGIRRSSRALLDQKDISPAILKVELVSRVMALSVKRDWPAVDQHLSSLEKNNLDLSTSEIEVMRDFLRLLLQ
jgi:hypothetical protein